MGENIKMRILNLKQRINANFNESHWEEMEFLLETDFLSRRPRILKALRFGDDDYGGQIISLLKELAQKDPEILDKFETYLDKINTPDHPQASYSVQAAIQPTAFKITHARDEDLVSLMTPLSGEFEPVFRVISKACDSHGMRCQRASDIWRESIIIQDIVNLICRSKVVIVDLTGKNPNVMYELSIAHALGKDVIPISQSIEDIPFDFRHHRVLEYLNNSEGLAKLEKDLTSKLSDYNPIPF